MPRSTGVSVGKIKALDEDEWLFLFDRGAHTYYADLVTEVGAGKGIVRLSFAAVSVDGDGIPKGTVVCRVRLPVDIAAKLCETIKELKK